MADRPHTYPLHLQTTFSFMKSYFFAFLSLAIKVRKNYKCVTDGPKDGRTHPRIEIWGRIYEEPSKEDGYFGGNSQVSNVKNSRKITKNTDSSPPVDSICHVYHNNRGGIERGKRQICPRRSRVNLAPVGEVILLKKLTNFIRSLIQWPSLKYPNNSPWLSKRLYGTFWDLNIL